MQVSVESKGAVLREMKVGLPGTDITKEVNSRLQKLGKKMKMHGFRPGKIPMRVIRQQYGSQVQQEVVNEVIQKSIADAMRQEQAQPVAPPKIVSINEEDGLFEYTATYEIRPEVTLAPLDGVTLERKVSTIEESDFEEMLLTLRKQRRIWSEVARESADGDRVQVNFEGTMGGEPFSGNSGQGVEIILGEGRMIAGFEEGLRGKQVGDKFDLDLRFPDNYAEKGYAGKDVRFAVEVTRVEEASLPEIDEAFIKDFGIEDGDRTKFDHDVRNNMELELQQRLKKINKDAVIAMLLEKQGEFEIPSSMIEEEAKRMRSQMQSNMQIPQGKEEIKLDLSIFAAEAKRRLEIGFIFHQIAQTAEIKIEAERVKSEIERIAASYEQPQEVVNFYHGDKNRLGEIESLLMEEDVVAWVMSQVTVVEKGVTFAEMIKG
ncbi:MAG: trigger factor [Gammaproteobacteria bacterium]|nr:trigger factor [Gammaproteobacteria bacterium]